MIEFRLAVRQYAINKEFELRVVKTDRERYIGGCKGDQIVLGILLGVDSLMVAPLWY
jgi:hypothetical protein